jgi:hypothetical protein
VRAPRTQARASRPPWLVERPCALAIPTAFDDHLFIVFPRVAVEGRRGADGAAGRAPRFVISMVSIFCMVRTSRCDTLISMTADEGSPEAQRGADAATEPEAAMPRWHNVPQPPLSTPPPTSRTGAGEGSPASLASSTLASSCSAAEDAAGLHRSVQLETPRRASTRRASIAEAVQVGPPCRLERLRCAHSHSAAPPERPRCPRKVAIRRVMATDALEEHTTRHGRRRQTRCRRSTSSDAGGLEERSLRDGMRGAVPELQAYICPSTAQPTAVAP